MVRVSDVILCCRSTAGVRVCPSERSSTVLLAADSPGLLPSPARSVFRLIACGIAQLLHALGGC